MTDERERLREALRDYPCIHCGTPIDDCWEGHRCCDDSDHPYATAAETICELNRDIEAAALAHDRPSGSDYDLAAIDEALRWAATQAEPNSMADGAVRTAQRSLDYLRHDRPSGSVGLREALTAWLDSHGEPDIEERLAEAAKEWLEGDR
jgi:hypothetical protein